MAAQNITELAFQITADASGFYGEMTRVATATEKYVMQVTKAQQDLGAQRNDQGVLINAQNEVIEGLKNWQIALGYTRDGTGQLVNAQKQLIEGLTTVQQKMGFYKDELDNVYNSEGMLISQGAKAIALDKERAKAAQDVAKAIEAERIELERRNAVNAEAQAKAMADANQAVSESLRGIGQTLKFTTNMLVTFSAGSSASSKQLRALSASMAAFTSTAQMIPQITKWYKSLTMVTEIQTGAIKKQTIATGILNAVSGNWLTIVGGLAAAGGTFTLLKMFEDTSTSVVNATDDVNKFIESVRNISSLNPIADFSKGTIDFARMTQERISSNKEEQYSLYKSQSAQEEMLAKAQTWGTYWKSWIYDRDRVARSSIENYKQDIERLKSAGKEISKINKELEQNLLQSQQQAAYSAADMFKTEFERIEEQIKFLDDAIGKEGVDQDILQKAIANLNQKDYELRVKPLEQYMTSVEKVTKQFEWMDGTLENIAGQTERYQRALEERAKAMERASLEDSLTAEQRKLYDQIKGYMSPWEQFSKTLQDLTDLNQKFNLNSEGLMDAMNKNKDMLLSSTQYGRYIKQAQEGLLSTDDKLRLAFDEIERLGDTLNLTRNVIDAARTEAEKDIRDAENKKQQDEERRGESRGLAFAERGSLEAYKIIYGSRQDAQRRALEKSTNKLVKASNDNTEKIVQAYIDNNPFTDIGIV